jgi:hypothetical protein
MKGGSSLAGVVSACEPRVDGEPPMSDDLGEIPEDVLYRIHRGDAKGRPFGTPRNPRAPTPEEFNPRLESIRAIDLEAEVVARRHGIEPEQARRVAGLGDEDLVRYRPEDPISAARVPGGLSLTGGHHRVDEIIRRARAGPLAPETIVRVLIHD